MKKNAFIVLLVIAVAIGYWLWESNGKEPKSQAAENPAVSSPIGDIPASPEPKENRFAPAFELDSLDGTTSYSVGGKRDKALIVNFWAAWCGPCELEAPDLKDIYDKHKEQLDLYAVNATNFDKVREAKDFVKEQQFVFPVLTDVKGVAGDLYKVNGYPISFIIDRDGVIRHRIQGIIDREQWELYLQEVLES
ncbi:TlpA family protein disulfide reductase [Cohnella terricola]|uniref:TlpA family protein disulfide reductase n=1 Tax=Cohnella terricola TaxID=1289167 RepID=A0A559JW71_9BACL|nr:TlpA disulfide reductase family protein [Cohnella terricola]TVY04134.1 TlpA family protein disulfide reductase [Cohnella terricola]